MLRSDRSKYQSSYAYGCTGQLKVPNFRRQIEPLLAVLPKGTYCTENATCVFGVRLFFDSEKYRAHLGLLVLSDNISTSSSLGFWRKEYLPIIGIR